MSPERRIDRCWSNAKRFAFLVACCGITAAQAAVPVDCVVQCLNGCKLRTAEGTVEVTANKPQLLAACPDTVVVAAPSPVYGMFQTGKGPQRFTVKETGKTFASLVPGLAKATCALGSSCIEDREQSRRAGTGGKGADEDTVVRSGKPCELGLPCGQVLRPKQALLITLTAAAAGKFTLIPKRGGSGVAAAPSVFEVRDGRLELPAAALHPGAVYHYALDVALGGAPVRGEFSVLSSRLQADVEKAIADAPRTDPESAGLVEIEILIEEKLLWDATRKAR